MRTRSRAVTLFVLMAIVAVVLVVVVLPAIRRAQSELKRVRSRSNLNRLAQALSAYVQRYGAGRFYPLDLSVLHDVGLIKTPHVFLFPGDNRAPLLPNGWPCSYVYAASARPNVQAHDLREQSFPPGEPLVWERKPFLPEGTSILYGDGHIEFRPVQKDPAALPKASDGEHPTP